MTHDEDIIDILQEAKKTLCNVAKCLSKIKAEQDEADKALCRLYNRIATTGLKIEHRLTPIEGI